MKNLKFYFFLTVLLFISSFSFGQKYTDLTATSSTGNALAAVDNNMGSRWESESSDPQWIIADLGETKNIGTINIYWETANAKNYSVSFSNDGTTFSNELFFVDKAAGARMDNISDLNLNFRYIKINGTERTTGWGYSIWEIEIFPQLTSALTTIEVTPANSSMILGNTQQFIANGKDQVGNNFSLISPTVWSVIEAGGTIDVNGTFTSSAKGLFTITATNSGISGNTKFEVLPTNQIISVNGTATASSGNANLIIDNDKGSRWESEHNIDPQWVMIDLETKMNISDMIIYWEGANAKNYFIETSVDGITWTNFTTQSDLPGGSRIDRFYDINKEARYVKLTGTERNLPYGYSIFEFFIYGIDTSTSLKNAQSNVKSFYNNSTKSIQFSETIQSAEIYDYAGRTISSSKNTNKIDIKNLNGLYILKYVDNDNNYSSLKFIAQ